ncbi:hypothetical protein GC102_36360 [Paenibacillus sp. LMG 31460]|uniref:Uncharacterized protein n=1 Tax=Paenibacillus germinis TaxID=2654979 RepID=A0ABX1ZCV4_9BACL|nr:hypothetical protein [Paenibacillus germinis]NOU91162.1 hypothetical protein [Paenibacillus germinis]
MFFFLSIFFALLTVTFFIIYLFQSYKPTKLTISAPFGLGAYEFDRATLSEQELNISWKLYVQLTTRKTAIPIDEENDVIVEVYDSWYELFKTTREYLIELPASELEGNENAQEIVRLSLDVLNKGLRPHLTTWQGKYRKWYDNELKKETNEELSPQEVQRKYSKYPELIGEIKDVNKELAIYANELKRFSHEKPSNITTKSIKWIRDILDKFK